MQSNSFNSLNIQLVSKLYELKQKSIIQNLIEEENKFDPKYKTELCKKYQTIGKCPYGNKCRFAHGKEELITKYQGANYKLKNCKTFMEKGYCPYGLRCSFKHNELKFSEINFSYFYFQLFLFKKYNFTPPLHKFYQKKTNLLYGRLEVFESLTNNNNEISEKNNFQKMVKNCKPKLYMENISNKENDIIEINKS